ncbi:MAG: SMP-30/gluconolactonase/LRE family protein [Verrucomicrobia bacterium]|nr:SMP-30/gluconolactonase/LRE family protein [Verrucomicrobiota bacterium]
MFRSALIIAIGLSVLLGSAVAGCVPSATPDPAAGKAARTEIATFESFLTEPLCERMAVKYQLASDYAIIGDFDKTIALAAEVAQADQGFDFPLNREFKVLEDCPEFIRIADAVHSAHAPVHHAAYAFTIDDPRLIPEGLAYDERTQTFLMGSLNEKKIIRYSKQGVVADFVATEYEGLSSVLGIRFDPRDGSVWVASGLDAEHAALFHFSSSGEFIAKYRPPEDRSEHLFNDLIVQCDGTVFLTDSTANQVYRLPAGETKLVPVRTPRVLCYPNGIALSPDERTIFIADAFGVLASGETDSHPVQPSPHITLSGFDGLYTWRDCLVGVQNSMGSPRIVVTRLNADRTRATASAVLEYRTEYAQLPTTGALVGDTFYYITNSQIDHYKDGKLLSPETLAPILVAKVRLVEPQ